MPNPRDWLLMAIIALLTLAGLGRIDEYDRLQQQIATNQANVARIHVAEAGSPATRRRLMGDRK
jgi:hypothetical protein